MHRKVTTCTLAALLLAAIAGAQTAPEMFRGNLLDTNMVSRGTATFLTLQVDRWGTPEEADAYLQVIKEKGQKGLQEAFWDAKGAGWIRIGTQLGYPIVFARSLETPDGRIVRAFTDRPISFFELRNNLRSTDYPLGIVELKLDAKGKGEGTLIAAASAKFDDQGQLVVENFGTQPFKIVNVKKQPVKAKDKKK